MGDEGDAVQFAAWLGVEDVKLKREFLAVFVPSRTRDGDSIDHQRWRNETVRLMSGLFGGATSLAAYGGWLDEERNDEIKEEGVSIVWSFYEREEWDEEAATQVRDFVYRMGGETKQGAVGLVLMGHYIEIPDTAYEQIEE